MFRCCLILSGYHEVKLFTGITSSYVNYAKHNRKQT